MTVHFEKISTWRQRIGQAEDFPLHVPTDVERAMVEEIADLRALAAAPLPPQVQPSEAARDVLAERRRQIEQEGWTAAHDDKYRHCELARAAASYAVCAHPDQLSLAGARLWPFHIEWFKRTTYRRDLIKSGALILAEIERLDRAADQQPVTPSGAQGVAGDNSKVKNG